MQALAEKTTMAFGVSSVEVFRPSCSGSAVGKRRTVTVLPPDRPELSCARAYPLSKAVNRRRRPHRRRYQAPLPYKLIGCPSLSLSLRFDDGTAVAAFLACAAARS